MQWYPKVHPDDILDDLYHTPVYRAKRAATQHGFLRRRVRGDSAGTEFPQMHAYVRACGRGASISTGASGRTMFEEDDEVLRGVKGKVLDS